MTEPVTENQAAAPSADFVRRLRRRAEEAAESAVHHATLSERYQELSRRLSRLAEQAGSTDVQTLRAALATLDEPETSATAPAEFKTAPSIPTKDPPPQSTSQLNSQLNSQPAPTMVEQSAAAAAETGFESTTGSQVQTQESPASNPVSINRRTRSASHGREKTRSLVQRFRAVRLAARRIRIRARKQDLQPRTRSPVEELKRSRQPILSSVTLLILVVVVLSTIRWQVDADPLLDPIVCSFAEEPSDRPEPEPVEIATEDEGKQKDQKVDEPAKEPPEEPDEEPPPKEEPPTEPIETIDPEPPMMAEVPEPPAPELKAPSDSPASDANASSDAATADHRSAAGRQALLQKYGGSAASEAAVQRALDWLISVQHPSGYWDFNAVGPSGNAGTVNNPIGGTAYALLPFLAAGQTHREGNYQKQIGAALTYLSRIGVRAPAGYDLRGMINKQSDDKEPNEAYYVHGAATLALCEAYGMTKDRRLKPACEGAVRFLINSQDPRGGGWRYNPQQPGSTSVTAIQVMALMAARKAGLEVPESVFDGVRHYLNSVQVDQEGRYGYEIQKKRYTGAVTAMALLCRMYLGWARDDGDLRAGIRLLDKAGPYDNLYSLYFATQVMKNWGGEEWERWNQRLRDDLIAVQETEGPAAGSWKPRTGAIHAKQGGRLLSTCLATLTLQVYYRYQPLLPESTSVSSTD